MNAATRTRIKTTRYAPVGYLADIADRYSAASMLAPLDWHTARVMHADERRGIALGEAYLALPGWDDAAKPAYRAFAREILGQYVYLTGVARVHVTVSDTDPYDRAEDMAADLRDNRHLAVLSTAATGGHPYLTDSQNDMFRAVHDAFGHAAVGRGFDRHSEEAAWFAHSHMFTPAARRALTVETRGQNSAFTWILNGADFPEQKLALLPPWASDVRQITTYHNARH